MNASPSFFQSLASRPCSLWADAAKLPASGAASWTLQEAAPCWLALLLLLRLRLFFQRPSSESLIRSWCQTSSTFAFFRVMFKSLPVLPSWKRLLSVAMGPGSRADRSVQVRPLRSTALTTTCRSSKSTWASRKVPALPLSMLASTCSFTVPGLPFRLAEWRLPAASGTDASGVEVSTAEASATQAWGGETSGAKVSGAEASGADSGSSAEMHISRASKSLSRNTAASWSDTPWSFSLSTGSAP
mmetsp:Transcript_84622/g.263236  ORF Transcript_84622/g.263236 Transcript_84622/m.263236 type:complete len:244 (-) Transcript_84622:542-1273(-)